MGRGDAGVKSVAVAVRRSLAYAPCGDAVTPSVCFADTSLLYRVPAKILRSKRFVGRGRGRQGGKRSKRGVCRQANTRKERPEWGPQKIFATQIFFGERARKRFLDKAPVGLCPLSSLETAHGACRFLTERGFYRARTAGIQSVQFGLAQTAAKFAPPRRGAADRPRTDTPFRYRILSPARLPIPPRRHMRRPEKDGAAFYQRRLIRLRKGRERRRRLRARSRRFVRKKQALLLRDLRFRPDRAHPSRCAP